jgi:hypothetical protein
MSKDRKPERKPKRSEQRTDLRQTQPTRAAKPAYRRLLALSTILVVLIVAAVYWNERPEGRPEEDLAELPLPEDPRATFRTPFLNVRADVKYLGDEACAACHRGIVNRYRQHPMGRSLAPIAEASNIESLDPTAHNPFEVNGFSLLVEKRGDQVFHKAKTLYGGVEAEEPIAYAVGSGRRGRSYIINHDGYLFESPLTWFPLEKRWGLSPGYEKPDKLFTRPIVDGCVFCHANQAQLEGDAANHYKSPPFRGNAIGCERCHGPGELHVKRRQTGSGAEEDIDYSIVNPRHLEHSLREAVCRQCHFEIDGRVLPRGRALFEYRPGLPLHLFLADFQKPEDQRVANQFLGSTEQMVTSQCYKKSSGADKLGCISCHDPHGTPALETRAAFYSARCMKCHEQHPCSLPAATRLAKSSENSCIQCHMPSLSGTVLHTSVTNHSVPRHADNVGASPKGGVWPGPGGPTLVPFPPELAESPDADLQRNMALALVSIAVKHQGKLSARQISATALPLLEKATGRDRHDIPAWVGKATAVGLMDRPVESLQICLEALAIAPKNEDLLFIATMLAAQLNRAGAFEPYLVRAIEVNPRTWQYRRVLAQAFVEQGQWDKAAEAARAAIKLNPANLFSRQILIRYNIRIGNRARAATELEACLGLVPPAQRDEIRRWFQQLTH